MLARALWLWWPRRGGRPKAARRAGRSCTQLSIGASGVVSVNTDGGKGVGGENEGGLRALPFGRKAKWGESETERAGSPVQAGAQGGSRKLCRQRLRGARPLKCRATDRGSRTTERAVCHDPPRDPPPGAFAPGPALQARPSAPRRAQGSEGRVSLSRLSVGTAFRCLLLSRLSTRQSEFVFLATSVPR